MKEKKYLKKSCKMKLRIAYRTKRIDHEKERRERLKEKTEREAHIKKEAPDVLQADNKKMKNDKKPGSEVFLAQYSYIPITAYDLRHCISSTWKPKSFNKKRQHDEFLKQFVYPYPLPETIFWAALESEFEFTENGNKCKSASAGFIQLAKKWIVDITSGESFYKRNKKFFTKAEAYYFLASKVPYVDCSSVIKLYFYAKCRARALSHELSMMIADVFSVKFLSWYGNTLVEGFLDLIVRTPEYNYESTMLGDLSDFVLMKIREAAQGTFSFSGRTISSVMGLTNEWHERLRNEAEYRRIQGQTRNNEKPIDTSKWKGLGKAPFHYKADDCLWMITELRTAKDLLNEGRKMHNCVSSYAYSCASGGCSIFTVQCAFPGIENIEKVATLEVKLQNRALVQAKGKCNAAITPRVKNIVTRWATANRISVRLQV
jgi:hypothetical protein